MTIPILNRIPDEFTHGDTVRWTENHSNFLASTWTLTYYFVKDDGTEAFEVEATQYDGSDTFLITINAAAVASITSGRFNFKARVTDETDIDTVLEGVVQILDDFADAVDTRSNARKILAAIDAAIEGTASITQKRLKVRDREIEKYQASDLIALRSLYAGIVKGEDDANRLKQGLNTGNTVRVRFK